jgi:hypothetical protein
MVIILIIYSLKDLIQKYEGLGLYLYTNFYKYYSPDVALQIIDSD